MHEVKREIRNIETTRVIESKFEGNDLLISFDVQSGSQHKHKYTTVECNAEGSRLTDAACHWIAI